MANSAYVAAVRWAFGEYQVLLGQKQVIDMPRTVQSGRLLILPNPGQFVLPGGHVEAADASDWAAAAREFGEETGVVPAAGAISRLLPTVNAGTDQNPYQLAFFLVRDTQNSWMTALQDQQVLAFNMAVAQREALYTIDQNTGLLTTTDQNTGEMELHRLLWAPFSRINEIMADWPQEDGFRDGQYEMARDLAPDYGDNVSDRYWHFVATGATETPTGTLCALNYLREHARALLL